MLIRKMALVRIRSSRRSPKSRTPSIVRARHFYTDAPMNTTTHKMEAHNPPPDAHGEEARSSIEKDEQKREQSANPDTMDVDVQGSVGGTPAPGADGLTKHDYETMRSIIDQLTNYEEK